MSHTKPGVNYLAQLRKRYGKASKRQQTAILHQLVATTGYQRNSASLLLGSQGYQHLLRVSASTMDRWRRAARRPGRNRHSGTTPGSLLKQHIPIRTFTRVRVGRKNENAFVEEKNRSAIRRSVGDGRYDTPTQVRQRNAFSAVHRLDFNHFRPVTKLVQTHRQGSRLKKSYAQPKTPDQRVPDAPEVSDATKLKLRREHAQLDVVALKQEWDRRLAALKPTPQW